MGNKIELLYSQNTAELHNNLLEFVVESPNQMAYTIAHELVRNASSEYNPIVFFGPPKSGKTHLMRAIMRGIYEKFPECPVVFLDGNEFYEIYSQSLRDGHYQEFREVCRGCHCFFLDGFQLLCNKKNAQEELMFTVDELQQKSRQIILSSISPLDMTGFSPALLDRLKNGLALRVQPLSEEKVIEYSRERANAYGITVDAEVLRTLWQTFPGSFGEFKIVLLKLYQFLSAGNRKITPSLAKAWVKIHQKQGEVDLEKILDLVGQHFGIASPKILCEKSGLRNLIIPRYLAIALAKEGLKMNTRQLSEHFGKISASAVRNALKKVATDPALQALLKELLQKILGRK